MSKKSSHVVPSEGRWAVRQSGNERATKVFDSQKDAVTHARGIAKKEGTTVYVHRKDGSISSTASYNKKADSSTLKMSANDRRHGKK